MVPFLARTVCLQALVQSYTATSQLPTARQLTSRPHPLTMCVLFRQNRRFAQFPDVQGHRDASSGYLDDALLLAAFIAGDIFESVLSYFAWPLNELLPRGES